MQDSMVRKDCLAILTQKNVIALEPLRKSNLVITGGTGFMGSWLLEMIAALNDEYKFNTSVVVYSREPTKIKISRPQLSMRDEFTFQRADVRNPIEFPQKTQWIIHAAAVRDRRFHASCPVETIETIINGTQQVLDASLRCAELRMIQNVSSGFVTNYLTQPNNVYESAKNMAEIVCRSYQIQERLPVMTVRPYSFIGPYQSLDSPWAVTNFIQDALSDKDIRILGNGSDLRSYMYASDMAYWLLKSLVNSEPGEIVDVGSANAIQLKELAGMITQKLNPQLKIILSAGVNTKKTEVSFYPQQQKTNKFNFEETILLDLALNKTIDWYKAHGKSC